MNLRKIIQRFISGGGPCRFDDGGGPRRSRATWRENNWARAGAVLLVLVLLFFAGQNFYYDAIPINQLSSQAAQARLSGDNKTALRLYKIVSARASRIDFTSNYELGNILSEMDKYTAAEHYYLRASNNAGAPTTLYYQLSDLYLKHLLSKRDSFIILMKKRIASQPTQEGFVIVLASFYQQIGDKNQAITWYEQALKLDPNNSAVAASIRELKASL